MSTIKKFPTNENIPFFSVYNIFLLRNSLSHKTSPLEESYIRAKCSKIQKILDYKDKIIPH